jgi:Tfp pilus assembly protein PilW
MLIRRTNLSSQRGLSLIELMIGLAMGLFLVAGVIGIFSTTLSDQTANLKSTRLNQELRTALDVMVRDIRRAGYWSLATSAASPPGNLVPSTGSAGAITLNVVDDDGTTAIPAFTDFGTGNVTLAIIAAGTSATTTAAANITTVNSTSQASGTTTNAFGTTDTILEGSWMIANPFTSGTDDIRKPDSVTYPNCITYTYDADNPGVH